MAVNGISREGLFDAAVSAVLKNWPALKMAVANQFGGPQSQAKAMWMESATAQWVKENVDIQADELETFLETLLDQEFDTIIEDGSTAEVSRKICELHRSCCSGGDQDAVQRFLASQPSPPPPTTPLSPVSQPPSGEEKKEEKMEEEVAGTSNDGGRGEEGEWEVVTKSRRRRSKN